MLRKEHSNKGYATEAVTELVKQAFIRLQLPYVVSLIETENTVAIRVAEKCGFTYRKSVFMRTGDTETELEHCYYRLDNNLIDRHA